MGKKVAVFTRQEQLLVAFQGTCLKGQSALSDLLHDGKILLNWTDTFDSTSDLFQEIFDALREYPDHTEVVVTGHSLGGSLACKLASKAGESGEHRPISGHIFNPGATWDLFNMLEPKLLGCAA